MGASFQLALAGDARRSWPRPRGQDRRRPLRIRRAGPQAVPSRHFTLAQETMIDGRRLAKRLAAVYRTAGRDRLGYGLRVSVRIQRDLRQSDMPAQKHLQSGHHTSSMAVGLTVGWPLRPRRASEPSDSLVATRLATAEWLTLRPSGDLCVCLWPEGFDTLADQRDEFLHLARHVVENDRVVNGGV
jgi:hypothetical protein